MVKPPIPLHGKNKVKIWLRNDDEKCLNSCCSMFKLCLARNIGPKKLNLSPSFIHNILVFPCTIYMGIVQCYFLFSPGFFQKFLSVLLLRVFYIHIGIAYGWKSVENWKNLLLFSLSTCRRFCQMQHYIALQVNMKVTNKF